MKKIKLIYTILISACAIFFAIKYLSSLNHAVLVSGQEPSSISLDWNRIISKSVNEMNVQANIDGQLYSFDSNMLYMDETRNFMVNTSFLTEYLQCGVICYPDYEIRIEKASNVLQVKLDSDSAIYNDEEMYLKLPVTEQNHNFYLPLADATACFDYSFEWDYENATVVLTNNRPGEKIYPVRYDYRDLFRNATVKNQADLGTCWAFASLTALETTLMPLKRASFSQDHMIYHCGYQISPESGGDYTMSMAYLTAWKGPVYEEEDPYGDGISAEGLSPAFHVQEIQLIDSKNIDAIKRNVFLYGGVQSSLYMSVEDEKGDYTPNYNPDGSAYCYVGPNKPNHGVVIVGWDDTYAAKNFAQAPEGDGAFVCVNSWGEQFGEQGYFYVSYYDSNIGMHNISYTRIDDTNNYDFIYQTDLCGWVGRLGYNRENAFFANVYEVDSPQTLAAVGFYATDSDTQYEVYVVENYEDEQSFANRKLLTQGVIEHAGYYTIDLEQEIHLQQGHRYAVVVNILTPGAVHPIAIEYFANPETEFVDIEDGEGYISLKGQKWDRVESLHNCNICLKMYTRKDDVK